MTAQEKLIAFFQFQLPVIAWCIFIYIASSIPSNSIRFMGGINDKFIHASVFALLCWLTHVALFHQPYRGLRRYALLTAILFTVIFGMSDEYHQLFTPGRSSDLMDLLADTAGGLLYATVHWTFGFYRDDQPA